jgi:hypothetical protein
MQVTKISNRRKGAGGDKTVSVKSDKAKLILTYNSVTMPVDVVKNERKLGMVTLL